MRRRPVGGNQFMRMRRASIGLGRLGFERLENPRPRNLGIPAVPGVQITGSISAPPAIVKGEMSFSSAASAINLGRAQPSTLTDRVDGALAARLDALPKFKAEGPVGAIIPSAPASEVALEFASLP